MDYMIKKINGLGTCKLRTAGRKALGIVAEILFGRNEQKDCREKPDPTMVLTSAGEMQQGGERPCINCDWFSLYVCVEIRKLKFGRLPLSYKH